MAVYSERRVILIVVTGLYMMRNSFINYSIVVFHIKTNFIGKVDMKSMILENS